MTRAFAVVEAGAVVAEHSGDRVVPWWSFGKTLIAATALALVERDRLRLDQRIGAASLAQLLRHEGGLRDYGEVGAYHEAVARGDEPWPRDELLRRARADDPAYAPGEAWRYSNIGYLKVREAIESAWGGGLGEAAAALVLAPMGVSAPRLATRPSDLAMVEMGAVAGYHPGWVYHGLFVGPLRDAARALDGLLGATSPLTPASRALLLEASDLPWATRAPWSSAAYGLGLMCPRLADGTPVAGHTGGGPGSSIAVYRRSQRPARTVAAFETSEADVGVETEAALRLRA